MKKRILALVMSCALFASMLPATVLADVEANAEAQTEDVADATEADEDAVSYDKLSGGDDAYEIEVGTDADAIETVDAGGDADVIDGITVSAEGDAVEAPDAEDAANEADAEDSEDADDEEDDAEPVTYRETAGGVIVEVTAPGDALPEGAELSVERYAENSADYKDAAEEIDYEADDESGMAAVDISFLLDGEEVEPTEPVKVSIDVSEILPSDADASSLEVQHLEESGSTVNPVVVANDSASTKGTIDEQKATAEFEVDSFSAFTVTWEITGGPAAATYTVDVYAYLDGDELDGIGNVTFNSENDELDLEDLLKEVGYGTGDYTFSYATVSYTSGMTTTTLGSADNPVVAIEIESTGGGPTASTNFKVVYLNGESDTFDVSATNVTVRSYYTTPDFSVSIEAVDEDEAEDWLLQAVLSHAGNYDHVTYDWTITNKDGSENTYATIGFSDTTGRVFIVWADGVEDNTEIIVSVTATLYDAENNVVGTATDLYDLEYGDETVDLIMTYGPDKTALPAGVTVTLTNTVTGKTVTGTTDASGWVHDLDIEPGIYTVTATYTDSQGNTYQCNETVAMHDAGNYSINLNYYDESILTNVTDRDNWEHIDIKLSVGTASTDPATRMSPWISQRL